MDYKKRKAEMLLLRKPPYSWTLQMIGDKYGITKARVQQILGKTSRYEKKNKMTDNRPLVDQRISALIAERKEIQKQIALKLQALRESVTINKDKITKEHENK